MIDVYREEISGTWFAVAVKNDAVVATSFSTNEEEVMQRLVSKLPRDISFQKEEKPNEPASKLLKTLGAMFDGEDVSLAVPLALDRLRDYTSRVLKCVSAVPIGYVTTYGDVARVAGGGPRAVGQVMASNPFPLLIPCHRVVRADLSLGGYGMGEKTKLLLLQRENRGHVETVRLDINGKALRIFPIGFLKMLHG